MKLDKIEIGGQFLLFGRIYEVVEAPKRNWIKCHCITDGTKPSLPEKTDVELP